MKKLDYEELKEYIRLLDIRVTKMEYRVHDIFCVCFAILIGLVFGLIWL